MYHRSIPLFYSSYSLEFYALIIAPHYLMDDDLLCLG